MSIILNNVTHTYAKKTPFEKTALFDINLRIDEGEFIAIAGHTGSGKSTLIQLIAGLVSPTVGNIFIDDVDLKSKDKTAVRNARSKVGIVFQYPELQLFEETVEKDIAFGPKNFNLSAEEVRERVIEAMRLVNLSYEDLREVSPFNLSGGQKRRIAIAGVLAMRPKYLILDEPTAGLDPYSRDDLMRQIQNLRIEQNVTIILVSHSMDDIAQFAKRVLILGQGRTLFDGAPREAFNRLDILKVAGLTVPSVTQLLLTFQESGLKVDLNAMTVDECEEAIFALF